MLDRFIEKLSKPENNAPLVVFRFLFGFIMLFGALRFWANEWIETLYIEPDNFFYYYGFSWVPYPGDVGIYIVFAVMAISALFIGLGLFYRISAILFFVSFTWVELIDISLYLNHYYFVSLMAGLLIFLPAGDRFSLDALRRKQVLKVAPYWTILAPKLLIGCLYFYAGVAKLNPDWLFEALPLKLWLPANSHLPLIGEILTKEYTAYLFSWVGMIFDLSVFFFLIINRTRPIAYIFVVIFHLSTAMLFQIGIFPYIMPLVTLIFFSAPFHEKIISFFSPMNEKYNSITVLNYKLSNLGFVSLIVFFGFMVVFPMRYIVYPGNLFWHEQGYRFGWRVMLAEKAGSATFYVHKKNGQRYEILPSEYLTRNQEKQMVTQPDLIIQFSDILLEDYGGTAEVDSITCECYATLNGGPLKPLIKADVNLIGLEDTWSEKEWIADYD